MENPDSCENFYVYTIKNYCDMLRTNNPLWSEFFANVEPPMRCPIKKVKLTQKNKQTYKRFGIQFFIVGFRENTGVPIVNWELVLF